MKLSTKGRYGLRAMLDVALHADEELVSISSIASRQSISEAYLEQLMSKLKKAGLIESQRGAAGGYRLAKRPDEICVGDVLRALEGNLDAVACPGIVDEGSCEGAELCVTKYVWQRINESITKTVDSISLCDLVKESRRVCSEAGKPEDVGAAAGGTCCR